MAASLVKIKGFVQTYTGYNFEHISERECQDLRVFLTEAFLAVRWEIETKLEREADISSKKQYIEHVQVQLSVLVAGLNGFGIGAEGANSITGIFDCVLNGVFDLFEYLRICYKPYFDPDTALPPKYIQWAKDKFWTGRDNWIDKIAALNVDPDLVRLLTDYNDASTESDKFTINTWRQWEFNRYTAEAIFTFLDHLPKGDVDLELLKLLISLEFNSILVYAYFIRYIERITLNEETYKEQQQQLLYLIKIFRQVRIDAAFMYDPNFPSLKVSVVESLEAELTYLTQKEDLLSESLTATDPGSPSRFYFTVAVTLPELMFFFRVMLEVKVIVTKFNSYLYDFVFNHIKTQRAENLSKQSQRNHLSNKLVPVRTVRNVKGWLEKMINHINLHYDI